MYQQRQSAAHTHEHILAHSLTHYCGYLLGFVVWCLTDAVQFLCAGFLAPFTLHTDVVVHLLGLLLCDAHTVPMIPVGAQVAANVEPLERKSHKKRCD